MSEEPEQNNYPQENQDNEIPTELLNQEPDKLNIKEDDNSKKSSSGHEILSEEDNKKYFLQFLNKNNLIKILITEKDIFPYKTYELSTSLEELQPKNDYFSNFATSKDLAEELNNSNTTINFSINKKQANIIELFFIFPIEGEDNTMEIELTANQINDREMFRQLFEKYQSIKLEQEEDVIQLKNRMNAIEEILTKIQKEQEMQKEQERLEKERLEEERLEKERENEEHNEEEHNEHEGVENEENNNKKEVLSKKNKNDQLNEIKSSSKGSKASFQKEKEKKVEKGKAEKKKQGKNVKINNKKIK